MCIYKDCFLFQRLQQKLASLNEKLDTLEHRLELLEVYPNNLSYNLIKIIIWLRICHFLLCYNSNGSNKNLVKMQGKWIERQTGQRM